MIDTTALTAMVRQTLSDEELAQVLAIIETYGESYDSIQDVIADAREMLR